MIRSKQQAPDGANHLQRKNQPRYSSARRRLAASGTRPWNQRIVEPRDALALTRW